MLRHQRSFSRSAFGVRTGARPPKMKAWLPTAAPQWKNLGGGRAAPVVSGCSHAPLHTWDWQDLVIYRLYIIPLCGCSRWHSQPCRCSPGPASIGHIPFTYHTIVGAAGGIHWVAAEGFNDPPGLHQGGRQVDAGRGDGVWWLQTQRDLLCLPPPLGKQCRSRDLVKDAV